MLSVALESAADAFLTVGALVAALFLVTGLIRVRWGPSLDRALDRGGRAGPALAALAAFPPGCIGVLAVSRLYVRGSVSFGTAVAALVSTMGDAAWLLLATDFMFTLKLKVAFAVLGAAVGFAVDAVGWAPERPRSRVVPASARASGYERGDTLVAGYGSSGADDSSADSCAIDSAWGRAAGGPIQLQRQTWPALLFWGFVSIGLLISLPIQLRMVDEEFLADAQVALGVCGLAAAIFVMAQSRCRVGCGEDDNEVERDVKSVLLNGAQEAAFVTVWVALAFTLFDVGEAAGWISMDSMPLYGVVGVVLGALLGLVPACSVELLVAGLFVAGGVPLPTLVAYLLSQDGNGFFPIAARRPRAAVWATVLTTVIAMVVGLALNALL